MALITGTTVAADVAVRAITVDFVNRFGFSVSDFITALGITRRIPMSEGSTIKRYKTVTDIKSGAVAEGDEIPLSKVVFQPDDPVVITLDKHRKLATAEAIQMSGLTTAINATDDKLLQEFQKGIRNRFFGFFADGTGADTANNLQQALAKAWAFVQTAFENDGVQTLAFATRMMYQTTSGMQALPCRMHSE